MIEVTLEKLDNNQWIPETIKLDTDTDFAIDDQALDAEMCKIGKTLVFYGDLAAELKAQANRKKHAAEFHYSLEAQKIRQSSHPGKRLTNDMIKEQIHGNATYQTLIVEQIMAEKDFIKVENFFRALRDKVQVMTALAYKQRAEINRGAW